MSGELKPESSDSLEPTGGHRIFSGVSYVLMWWSSLIVIQAFVIGQGLLPPIGQMNLMQALVTAFAAATLFVLMFSLNGQAGLKYGIPYAIQARSSFGIRGSKIVEFLRIAPAIIWYGVGTWIAAMSMDGILQILVGFSSDAAKFGYFLCFQAIQAWLSYRGIKAMKWFNVTGAVVIFAIMLYMLIHILETYGFQVKESWTQEGTWGRPFWVGLTGAIGVLATVMLNISDISRHLVKSQRAIWLGHAAGVLPPWFFMLFLGLAAGAAIGIWDPVQALIGLSPHPLAIIVLLAFILLAQFTTNLTINVLPPALVFMDTFKIKWGTAVIVTSVLGTLAFPWLIMANMEAFFGFILYYAAFFGPILGVMLADYFVVQRRILSIDDLYDRSPNSKYWYSNGVNLAGLFAIVIPSVACMIWFLPMAWMIGLPVSFVLYLLFYPRLARLPA